MNNKVYKLLLGMALLVATSACEPDLTVPLVGEITDEEALSDPAALRKTVNSIYQLLGNDRTYGGRFQIANDLLGEDIDGSTLTGDYGSIYTRTTTIFGDVKNQLYSEPYIAIYRANAVLENLEIVENQQDRAVLEGEAKFLRAIAHFALVRLFAQPYVFGEENSQPGIPIRTSTESSAAVRATVGEVYEQITSDLEDAAELLPSANGPFATEWAAKGFLAKVYFQMNDFEKAYANANDVIENSPFTFNSSSDEYSIRFSDEEESSEIVMAIYSDDRNTGIGAEFRNQYRSDVRISNLRVSPSLYTLATINDSDARSAWYDNETYPGNIVLTKYNKDFFNVPLVHITELKLIRAEAAAELNQNLDVAIADVNDIINRAYGENSSRLLPANAAAAVIKQRVREERRLELVGEGDRGQELKRRGALGENIIVRGAPYDCPGAILQFPQGEIANSPGFVKNVESGCN
ncbi:RagB/SusD family nutrient uptake outer membrane protein [Cesiribacter sp. SM1]|uniref:RagB/SusD family nutrient uptake outer membrane protein n=1 Tax=Cesiribacter sp. SM1 TaxID=2861196 RepID=UPI001CD79C52|nr:RagB/SusD family nutrient uptake outer membrane protein [Cesiribacter sp. SM1]